MTLPFQDARTLADGARARTLELGKALSLTVVDYGGFVVLIERMDGGSPDEDQQICEDIQADARLRQARAVLAVR